MKPLVNKIEASGLIVLDLSEILSKPEVVSFDLVPFLERGMLLREKAFREQLASHNWEDYRHKHVAVFCSNQALVQPWAWMLIQTYLTTVEAITYFSSKEQTAQQVLVQQIQDYDFTQLKGKRVMLKGCGAAYITGAVYGEFSKHLYEQCKSVMFGEPCSSVPIFKQKKK